MSGGFLAVQAKRTKERNKKVNLGCGLNRGLNRMNNVYLSCINGFKVPSTSLREQPANHIY